MFVKFHAPHFRNGAVEYEANKAIDVPAEIAGPEIAKGLAIAVPAPKEEPEKKAAKKSDKDK